MSGHQPNTCLVSVLLFQVVIKKQFAVEVHRLPVQAPGVQRQPGPGVHLVQVLGALAEVVHDGGQRRDDGGGPEPVGDGGEVAEVPLDGGVQQGLGPRVAQRAAVLVEELHQLVAHVPATIHTYLEHAHWTHSAIRKCVSVCLVQQQACDWSSY